MAASSSLSDTYPSDSLSSEEIEESEDGGEKKKCPKRRKCTPKKKQLSKRVRRMSCTPGCRILVLVRHGDYKDWSEDQGLTSAGRIQAWQASKGILNLSPERSIFITEKVVHSALKRAQETAQIIAAMMTVSMECDPLLNEGDPSNPDVKKQFDDIFDKYFVPVKPSLHSHVMDIIVAHANVIRYLVCKITGGDWKRLYHPHCGLTAIKVKGPNIHSMNVLFVGSHGHLSDVDLGF